MKPSSRKLPIVLTIGGHDPGGGAGIQADIEAVGANGCHCSTAITCLTLQDSCDVQAVMPLPAEQVIAQAETVLKDCQVSVIKIGLLGDVVIAHAIAGLLREHENIPVVLDPVLAAGGGTPLATESLLSTIRQQLLPLCTLITPNSPEARRLAPHEETLEQCAHTLLKTGAEHVLITGTHEQSDRVTNRLYDKTGLLNQADWQRLPGEYHGSGCTLAAAIAANMASGKDLIEAVNSAQQYTWKTLLNGFRSGRCQSLPDRLQRQSNQPET
ncbi:MAG: phosphomethylpyrimidine kinase [Gammaproteobacteria bacterium (ex Lamellibrachia satsuma)]|nr:MAG: hydroxymethylpyrimidine/phosphomethylpyrimidine kinase [Gammaproteobacteria bacterium (ex Lamellibrachia satsuma)]RRS34007.1 MAG: phosphomethylpyrimidine kinase [Gammaproteobacteria bacterium (ex Lamellibrachia satsuma)]RRS35557.1 MAG: phosphomethylpyrimidine kinase [Gammaproteobacteria bacterium (ex Lamellibrachia satsuma)]